MPYAIGRSGRLQQHPAWKTIVRGLWRTCFTALTLISFLGGAAAQDYPNRTIRIIVPYGAGMVSDTMARIIADRLALSFASRSSLKTVPAPAAWLGNDMVANAAPDGYTLLSQTMASLGPAAADKMPYDPVQDFAGISPIANVAGILVATKSRGFKTLKDLVAYAEANPGVLSYASLGPGSPSYIYSES
jgi:tripartite-type tricarboxylate transporter receptor subunit TctC